MKYIFVIASEARQSIAVSCIKARWIATACGLAMTIFLISPAAALTVDAKLPDRAQEARAQALFHELRCVVCQGEAIADSPADVARDLRRVVREEIASGKSDDEVKSFLVDHYGERVLMMPVKNTRNAPLWLLPLILLLGGALFAWKRLFRRGPQ
ncbi:MAG: cytochrome c-type biogenesis protein [Alphaproteobacteria bacterium]|nr:cytochrome c-type biogenesis protein [Alphaproteobacteria bacterium]